MQPSIPSAPQVSIRPGTVADAAVLSQLAAETFAGTFSHTCPPSDMTEFLAEHYSEAQLATELADPDQFIYFAIINGLPAGYLQFSQTSLPYDAEDVLKPLELLRIYVHQEWQGQGVAGRLMDYYLDFARREGYDYCWLGVWEHNFRAQRFYARYGFTFSGHTHPFRIGQTEQLDQWWGRHLGK